jgi:hypothetical protein
LLWHSHGANGLRRRGARLAHDVNGVIELFSPTSQLRETCLKALYSPSLGGLPSLTLVSRKKEVAGRWSLRIGSAQFSPTRLIPRRFFGDLSEA